MSVRNLLIAEWRRLFARRVTVVMLVVITGIMVLIAMGFAVNSNQPSSTDRARAEDMASSAQAVWDASRRQCLDVERGVTRAEPGRRYPTNCDYGQRPTADDFLDYGFMFRREWPALYYTAAIILGLFGFVIGASYVGAEWTSGGMTNLLLWRPRRLEVLGAKLAVAVGGVLAIAVGYLLLWTVTFLGVAVTSGAIGTMTSGAVGSLVLTAVRVVLLAALGSTLGFAIASLGRHTAMALGVGIAYLLVYELGATILFGITGNDFPERFRLSTYLVAWLTKHYEVTPQSFECNTADCVGAVPYVVGWGEAGVALGGVAVALVLAAFAAMRRRDVA